MICSGLWTALITPFINDNVDFEGLKLLLQKQEAAQVQGILLFGSTGEGSTLLQEEKWSILKHAKEYTTLPIMVNSGTNATRSTVEQTLEAAKHGADSALVVVPYYNKPTQEGIYQHFLAVAQKSPIPLLIYNIPGRTATSLHIDTFKRLINIPSIVGIKECSGSLPIFSEMLALAKKMRPDFLVVSGDDPLFLPSASLGCTGLISIASNLIPQTMHKFVKAACRGDFALARCMHHAFFPFFQYLFYETNPIPIKAALTFCGLPAGHPRLPLTPLNHAYKNSLNMLFETLDFQDELESLLCKAK